MRNVSYALIVLGLTVTWGGCADGPDAPSDTFDGDCGPQQGCGTISLRWRVDRAGKDAMCADVAAAKVVLTATYQADSRSARFEATCASGALLTTSVPLGPYALSVVLADDQGEALATATAETTVGVPGVVTEARVDFDVTPTIIAGGVYGSCGASTPCRTPSDLCVAVGSGSSFCSPPCFLQSGNITTCSDLYQEFEPPAGTTATCRPTPESKNNLYGGCFIPCVNGTACLSGLTCQQHPTYGAVCAP